MKMIRPVSDLRNNFADISKTVHETAKPVFLTKNGRGRYAIVDMEEYERTNAIMKLMADLEHGRASGREKGYIDFDDVLKSLGIDDV